MAKDRVAYLLAQRLKIVGLGDHVMPKGAGEVAAFSGRFDDEVDFAHWLLPDQAVAMGCRATDAACSFYPQQVCC